MKLKPGTPVEITWVDTFGTAGWENILELPEPPIIKTIGYYIKHVNNGVYLAGGLSDSTALDNTILAPCWIPEGCIKKIKRLR